MKKYIEKKSKNGDLIQLVFNAPDADNYFDEKGMLSDFSLTCKSGLWNKTKWNVKFLNQTTPGQPWNGFELISVRDSDLYVGIGDTIRKINLEDGSVLNEFKYADGAILNISKHENGYLIEYSWCDMNSKDSENLICSDFEGNVIWKFPRQSDSSVVTGFEIKGQNAIVWTFDCFRHEVDLITGEISKSEWTK
jgi:hypothetical protein